MSFWIISLKRQTSPLCSQCHLHPCPCSWKLSPGGFPHPWILRKKDDHHSLYPSGRKIPRLRPWWIESDKRLFQVLLSKSDKSNFAKATWYVNDSISEMACVILLSFIVYSIFVIYVAYIQNRSKLLKK